ncbi:MAG: hypothetical protein IT301_06245 [Dehalococcoidia bacterium]|nr:hypothetical protein [Dehalococcoidia bacterium]
MSVIWEEREKAKEKRAETTSRLLLHWFFFAQPGMTEYHVRHALRHCLDCWEIGGRVLWIFGVVLDRSVMPK